MQHIEQMKATAVMKPRELHKLGDEFVSIYLNQQSFQCARLAAGSCLNALDQILCGQVRREWLCSVTKLLSILLITDICKRSNKNMSYNLLNGNN